MAYRGDDLDLRTPQAAPSELAVSPPAAMGDLFAASQRSRATQRAAPIWVDDTVLDCCNHAYDVASAHRAAEVRIEHLVYALTRIDGAAEALEARGARVAALRREAAAVIATEIPTAQGNGKTNPRRAEAFEEVLRVAAAQAYRRQAPVTVADILYALLDSEMEFASLIRLLPTSPRSKQAAEQSVEPARERGRNGPVTAQSSRSGFAADLASLSAAQVPNQHSRIDAMEHAIRTLTTELANERKILSGVLHELQRELMAQREDTSRLGGITQGIFGDRLQSLEQAFLSARNPAGGDMEALQDRLGLLERALQAEISITRSAVEALAARPASDIAPLMERLDAIDDAAAKEQERAKAAEEALSEGIKALDAGLERQAGEIASAISIPFNERFETLTSAEDTRHAALNEGLAEAHRRLGTLEEALARLSDAETAAQEARSSLRGQVESLAADFRDAAEASKSGYLRLADGLTTDLSELHDGIAKLGANQTDLANTLDAEAQDIAATIAALTARIQNLEAASAKPIEMLTALTATVEKIHKTTVEKYYRRNRFWYWLFGTNDWLAASWPSQSARIAEELRNAKR